MDCSKKRKKGIYHLAVAVRVIDCDKMKTRLATSLKKEAMNSGPIFGFPFPCGLGVAPISDGHYIRGCR